jgi:hypothetical protein
LGILACASPSKYQTSSYDRLASKHKKIAILPIIFEGKEFDEKITDEEKTKLFQKENDFVQTALYQRIVRETGNGKNDVKISIESISTTNDKLKKNNIDIYNLRDVSEVEIANALGVDAVLRTKITTSIMLHSTKEDLPKEILSTARIFIKDPILNQAINLNVVQVFLSTELIDTKAYEAIWAYSKKRDLEVHDKNTDLLAWLTNDVARRFPYRK